MAAKEEDSPQFNKNIFDKAIRHVFNKKKYTAEMIGDKPVRNLVLETNRILGIAVDHGLKDNMPPAEMISKLNDDVFVFSACKTHIELKEAGSKLVDANGKIRSFQQFREEVAAIHKRYNENYLQAEYIFATSSAEMAAKWVDLEKDGDRYNLQYRTAQDDRVRDTHRSLANTTLPVGDPFWDQYYPPNGWRCRCTVVQVRKEKYPESNSIDAIKKAETATTQIDSKGRNAAAMFRFNPGKQQVIFPPNHPNYKVKENIANIISGSEKKNKSAKSAELDLIAWYKENLPHKQIGKFSARRFTVKRPDNPNPIIVNSTFYNELIAHYKTDKNYSLKLELAKKAHQFIKDADYVRNETPKHAKADIFKVYHYEYDGNKIELKCKEVDNELYLYYMRIL